MSLAWVVLLACINCLTALYLPTEGIDAKGDSESIKEVRTIGGYNIGDRQFEATSDTAVKKKFHEWEVISSDSTCEVNPEGIKPAAWRMDTSSEAKCQEHCLKRANCVAVDYIPGHKLCVFYNEACTTPQKKPKKKEGGVSSRLIRKGSWVAVNADKACHSSKGPPRGEKTDRDDEGIKILSRKDFTTKTLEECQASCLRRANCMSVDWFPEKKLCNWYDGVCNNHATAESGWISGPEKGSSWHLNLERGVSGLSMGEMKHFGEWVPISTNRSCYHSGDGIVAEFMIRTKSLKECQTACDRRSQCLAVDYYSDNGNCNLYTEACQHPRDTRDGASSYRIERKWLSWKAIDRARACEENVEGIGHVSHRLNVPEMTDCRDMCARRSDCVAFDFFRDLASCSLYNEACSGPLSDRHGASSYELERKDVVVESAPESKTGDGFSVQKGMKLRLW